MAEDETKQAANDADGAAEKRREADAKRKRDARAKDKEKPTPVFPEEHNLQRDTADSVEEPAGGVLAKCVVKCLYRGVLYKPGQTARFDGPIPPHFRKE